MRKTNSQLLDTIELTGICCIPRRARGAPRKEINGSRFERG